MGQRGRREREVIHIVLEAAPTCLRTQTVDAGAVFECLPPSPADTVGEGAV